MPIKKILYVTEFEELWFDALQALMDLKQAGLNHVIFLHVIDRKEVAMQRGVGYLKSEEVKLKEIANVRFIDWAETLFEEGMEVGAHIVVGNQVPKIVSIAEDEDVDLIVMGHQKKGRIQELYHGSEIMEVIREVSKPVMVYKFLQESGNVNDKPFKRPMLAMDWSPSSMNAVSFLLSIKDIVEKVQVVHVIHHKRLETLKPVEVQKERKENRKKLDELCDRLQSEGIDAEPHLYVGNIIEQLEKAARERKASIIIGGSTGEEPLKKRILGSVPRELSEKSGFPTLFVS
ncbi:MAG: universal stress protein [Spirochaetes bacterium]|nr:universal stress protein [Spirochaetota bacterium]